jgi:hypothetical protein
MSYNENMYYNEETWKPIYLEEIKHLYEVSNKGYVCKIGKCKKTEKTKGHLSGGYRYFRFNKGSVRKTVRIHRAVKLTFEPTENPEIYDVHHRDGNKENNDLSNLQTLTHKEHAELERKIGNNRSGTFGKKSPAFKGLIGNFNKEGYLLNTFQGAYELKLNGFCPKSVYKVVVGKLKTHKGFPFRRFPKDEEPKINKKYDLKDLLPKTKIKKSEKEVQMAFKF